MATLGFVAFFFFILYSYLSRSRSRSRSSTTSKFTCVRDSNGLAKAAQSMPGKLLTRYSASELRFQDFVHWPVLLSYCILWQLNYLATRLTLKTVQASASFLSVVDERRLRYDFHPSTTSHAGSFSLSFAIFSITRAVSAESSLDLTLGFFLKFSISLWISYGFPMVFLWFPQVF